MSTVDSSLTRVMALHAIGYCERLFYLEEVEEIRLADANVYAGRRLHEDLAEDETIETLQLEDEELGLIGKLDAIRTRNGEIFPYEHKRGRSDHGDPWRSDRLQVGAYAMLLERAKGVSVNQGRIRYHRDNKTVIVPINDNVRNDVVVAIKRADILRLSTKRPPIADNERLCVSCSLSPVCLPEEIRKANDPAYESIRLFPPKQERQTIHLLAHGDRIGRKGETLSIELREQKKIVLPAEDIGELVIHGYGQISTQAIGLCAYRDVSVHWMTGGGNYLCSLTTSPGQVQRRIAQYAHLAIPENRLVLIKQTVENRTENQFQFLMRLTRGNTGKRESIQKHLNQIRRLQLRIPEADTPAGLRGFEGACGNLYFSAMRRIMEDSVKPDFQFARRSRRPPKDRFNAILSFGYNLLYRKVMSAILTVGLEPSLGYYHTPRSSAHPLALDLMELFRVPLWDQPVIASLTRDRWDSNTDFCITSTKVWLSDEGRKKAISLFENRLEETWKHPVLNYSLSNGRRIELEVRLLEKSWTDGIKIFASAKMR